ncbi:hypothetical protein [Stenotrophomonas maltophilia]|uniref:hypothetical protein n=1 Tax=Stenotrophomonas maltophilia TaxID=40324 RepID=UPI0021CA4A66|nr:hypothetical protein [Stenotrophomonas maltophilia]MCU1136768.1 hypothetical protein [Stenotrophomonas maltophilia]
MTTQDSMIRTPAYPIDAALALHGRIYATLTKEESEVLHFYTQQGRKFGIRVSIESAADPTELEAATCSEHAEAIIRRANSTVSVTQEHW